MPLIASSTAKRQTGKGNKPSLNWPICFYPEQVVLVWGKSLRWRCGRASLVWPGFGRIGIMRSGCEVGLPMV